MFEDPTDCDVDTLPPQYQLEITDLQSNNTQSQTQGRRSGTVLQIFAVRAILKFEEIRS